MMGSWHAMTNRSASPHQGTSRSLTVTLVLLYASLRYYIFCRVFLHQQYDNTYVHVRSSGQCAVCNMTHCMRMTGLPLFNKLVIATGQAIAQRSPSTPLLGPGAYPGLKDFMRSFVQSGALQYLTAISVSQVIGLANGNVIPFQSFCDGSMLRVPAGTPLPQLRLAGAWTARLVGVACPG
jgi:hypothetical protein